MRFFVQVQFDGSVSHVLMIRSDDEAIDFDVLHNFLYCEDQSFEYKLCVGITYS